MLPLRECAYCGGSSELSRDHIPPKAIFPKPRPNDLISVPACRTCNGSFQGDDEYFAASLALCTGIERTPQGRRLVQTFLRSLKRPEAERFKSFLGGTLRVVGQDKGLYGGVPGTLGQWIDANRLGRTTSRIVRGLFYHETRLRLPADYDVVSILLEQADDLTKLTMIAPLHGNTPVEAANGAFAYVWKAAVDDPFSCTWLLVFYAEAATFLVATGKRSRGPA